MTTNSSIIMTDDCDHCRNNDGYTFGFINGKCGPSETCKTCNTRFAEALREDAEEREERLNHPDEEEETTCEGACGEELPESQVIYREETDGYCYGHMCDPCFELWKIEFENYPICRVCDIKFNPEGTIDEDYIERGCETCTADDWKWCETTKKMIPKV